MTEKDSAEFWVCPRCDRLFFASDGSCPDCGWSPENDPRNYTPQEVKADG